MEKKKLKPKAKIIFLSGFMGSGKTSAGELAAKKAGIPFVDLDAEVEKTANQKIAEMFEKGGERYFRQVESATLALVIAATTMISDKAIIVALGGGTITELKNAASVGEYGTSVFIDADFETCYSRIKDDRNRPLVKTREDLENLYKVRQKVYLKNAKHTIDGGLSLEQIAGEIAEIAQGLIKS
jgi:shikimate kinase